MALKLQSPSCLKIFHGDSRAHPAGPVISSVPAGKDATATYPDVNHPQPPSLRSCRTKGEQSGWESLGTSLFPKNNSGEPAFPLKSLIRGSVVGIRSFNGRELGRSSRWVPRKGRGGSREGCRVKKGTCRRAGERELDTSWRSAVAILGWSPFCLCGCSRDVAAMSRSAFLFKIRENFRGALPRIATVLDCWRQRHGKVCVVEFLPFPLGDERSRST